jgi:hypothetical protein
MGAASRLPLMNYGIWDLAAEGQIGLPRGLKCGFPGFAARPGKPCTKNGQDLPVFLLEILPLTPWQSEADRLRDALP